MKYVLSRIELADVSVEEREEGSPSPLRSQILSTRDKIANTKFHNRKLDRERKKKGKNLLLERNVFFLVDRHHRSLPSLAVINNDDPGVDSIRITITVLLKPRVNGDRDGEKGRIRRLIASLRIRRRRQ